MIFQSHRTVCVLTVSQKLALDGITMSTSGNFVYCTIYKIQEVSIIRFEAVKINLDGLNGNSNNLL
jgi:hypothetical protein